MHSYLAQLVDELHVLGVEDIVLSPGARSTPLAMLFCAHTFNVFMNVDERSAGFFALGIAKKSQKPAVLLCTSGSAPAHYLPAIIEAKHSRIPLIILTADRPPELQNVGAPQTIIQKNLFVDFIKHFEELAIPNNASPQNYSRNSIQKAFIFAMAEPKAPVHINVPLRDPLVVEEKNYTEQAFANGRAKFPFRFYEDNHESAFLSQDILQKIAYDIKDKNGLLVCGAGLPSTCHESILQLSKHLNAPILADPLSCFRNYEYDTIIDSYDAFLKSDIIKERLKPDFIFLFGQAPVSKRFFQLLTKFSDIEVFQVDTCAQYRNPSLTTSMLLVASPKAFATNLTDYVKNSDSLYLAKWQEEQKKMRTLLNKAKNKNSDVNKTSEKNKLSENTFFEGSLVQSIQKLLPQKSNLVIANSMSIRDVDFFWEKSAQNIDFFCNRGANGIDGTLSTALGISCKSKEKTILITGDLAFFHDMNALLLAQKHSLNLLIILINNNGGGIFQYLPQENIPHYSFLFETPHELDFSALRALFNVSFTRIDSQDMFEKQFVQALDEHGVSILEVPFDKVESKKLHKKFTTPIDF